VWALYRRGLLEELEVPKRHKDPFGRPESLQQLPPRSQAGHFAGIPFHFEDIDTSGWVYRLPGSTDTSLLSEIAELESVLSRRAESLGVEIRRGQAVTGVHQTANGVVVQAASGGSFRGKWLVGCDGSRSIVRKAGGFEFAGTEPEFTGYTTQVVIAHPEKLLAGRVITPTGMYFQSRPGYLIMQDFDAGAFHNAEKPVTLEHVQEVLRRISNTDVTIRALHIATTWTDRARQATSYRNGRILLAGDAAHIHSPLGGQGLNLGLGDAMNLGWKLAAEIQENAREGLLDSYFAERYPIGAQVLDWSRAQVAIMRPDQHARAVHAIFRDLMNTRDGATYVASRVWGVLMRNNLGDNHPLAGCSVPNFEFEDNTTVGALMHDGKGLLLRFDCGAYDRNSSDRDSFHIDTEIRTLATEYSNQFKYITGDVKDRLGVSTVLVRPDGVVAWASDGKPDINELRKAAARWFAGGRQGN
jgi:2-polyprenyl-6-methoxyphenol hydroxylase-like FAD-dependent oxidoreductase